MMPELPNPLPPNWKRDTPGGRPRWLTPEFYVINSTRTNGDDTHGSLGNHPHSESTLNQTSEYVPRPVRKRAPADTVVLSDSKLWAQSMISSFQPDGVSWYSDQRYVRDGKYAYYYHPSSGQGQTIYISEPDCAALGHDVSRAPLS